MLFMQKQLPCLDAITLYHCYNTNFGISNKKIDTYDIVENLKGPLFTLHNQSLCIVNLKY